MLPNQCTHFPSFGMQVSPQALFNPSFFPFAYPYYVPLALYPQNETYQMLQNQIQNKKSQIQSKPQQKLINVEKNLGKSELKKKSWKIERKEYQASTGNKNQLKRSIDFGQQKQGRNANSNLLRMFFRRLQFKIENEQHKLVKIWNKFNFTITVFDFIAWLRQAKIDYRNYIRIPSVKKLFKNSSKVREHCRILRVLLKIFIDEESICCYLTSRKIKKESMPHNLFSIRSIYQQLFTEETK